MRADNLIKNRYENVAALDRHKAYDMVPRRVLFQLGQKRLSGNYAAMIQCLLGQLMIRTKGHATDSTTAVVVVGVRQRDFQYTS